MYTHTSKEPLAIDTRKHCPVTYPVLDRGSRSPNKSGHHGPNPWNQILEPRGKNSKKKTKISKAQSPTTSAAARRIRKQKAADREKMEEEEAQKKGGVAYARMKREKATKMEREKRENHHHSKPKTKTKSKLSQNNTTNTTKNGIKKVKVTKGISKHNSGSSGNDSGNASKRTTASMKSTGSSTRRAATNTNTTKRRKNGVVTASSRPTKIPTPKKMNQLKQEADAQESIRALIDKVTIEFERLPSNVPTDDRQELNRNVKSVMKDVVSNIDIDEKEQEQEQEQEQEKQDRNRRSERSKRSERSACNTTRNHGSSKLMESSTRSRSNVDESIDLESVRVDIEINHQEVDREEIELQRRANALEKDMKNLKERKLKLHLAKYEHELRSASKEQLNAMIHQSNQDMNNKITTLKKKTKKQLESISEFEKDLKIKIQRLIKVSFLKVSNSVKLVALIVY